MTPASFTFSHKYFHCVTEIKNNVRPSNKIINNSIVHKYSDNKLLIKFIYF